MDGKEKYFFYIFIPSIMPNSIFLFPESDISPNKNVTHVKSYSFSNFHMPFMMNSTGIERESLSISLSCMVSPMAGFEKN